MLYLLRLIRDIATWPFKQVRIQARRFPRLLTVLVAASILISPPGHLSQLKKIQARGYLLWETRPSLITWFESADGPVGFEYEILKQFANTQGIALRVIPASERTGLLRNLVQGRVDLAGGNLTPTPQRLALAKASDAIAWTAPVVVFNIRKGPIETPAALKGLKGAVLRHSSYEHVINPLIEKHDLDITFLHEEALSDVLEKVSKGEFDYTVADANLVKLYSHFIPGLRIAFPLDKNQPVVFFTGAQNDDSLIEALNEFLVQARKSGQLDEWFDGYLSKLERHTPADTVTFLKHYRKRWPALREKIRTTAEKYALPWDLLGALAYQESHWNHKAVSPTGVKGLMMLTKKAAKDLGISDRTDLDQSLDGGARFFLKLYNKLPARITEPDRSRLALAAYNIGPGHLEDARVLTQRRGGNPDRWSDVKQHLPDLNNPEIAKTLKHGVADGKTAVNYVENISTYRQLLRWKESSSSPASGKTQRHSLTKPQTKSDSTGSHAPAATQVVEYAPQENTRK